MDKELERDAGVLSGLFHFIINDLKGSTPIWEDFLVKSGKLHSQLRVTMSCLSAFVEALQRVADMATNAQGATRDVGKALTRLCLRHKAFESRLKGLIDALQDALIIPMTDKVEDWKRITTQIDRTHSKEFKRAKTEIKKKSTDTLRLRKKVKRATSGGPSDLMQKCLSSAMQDISDEYILLEETQKQAVRRALIEQRRRYCAFVGCIKPVMDEEVHMIEEVSHLEEVVDSLCKLTLNPERLPSASEQIIEDAKMGYNLLNESIYSFHSPPSSPGSSLGSRKSSMCSISSESNSATDGIYGSQRHRSLSQPPPLQVHRLCSVSSQDSGFTSQDGVIANRNRPPYINAHNQLNNSDQTPLANTERENDREQSSLTSVQRENSVDNSPPSTESYSTGATITSPTYNSNTGEALETSHPPHLPKRNNSLPTNNLFMEKEESSLGLSSITTGPVKSSVCRSEPQSPQTSRAPFSLSSTYNQQNEQSQAMSQSMYSIRQPSHMSTLPARGRDRTKKVPPAPPVRRTPPSSTLNVALQLRQLEDTTSVKGRKNDKSPELPLPSPPAELLSPTEENSIYGRVSKSCNATLERPHTRSATQIKDENFYESKIAQNSYHDEAATYLGGICSQITEKFGNDSTENIYGTFGKSATKKQNYRRTESEESDEQTQSEAILSPPNNRNSTTSKIYKCASSDDIIDKTKSWNRGQEPYGHGNDENFYEPLNTKENLNESLYGSTFGVTVAISTNDIYGSTTYSSNANGRPQGPPPAPPLRKTPQRRTQSFSNDLYGTIEDDEPQSTGRSIVQQVRETFESQMQQSSSSGNLAEGVYGRIGSSSRHCSPFASSKLSLSMYQPSPGVQSLGDHHSGLNAPSPQGIQACSSSAASSPLPSSQFAIYATKNEVLTPGVPVSIPKVPQDLHKKRFMQQLNEKLAQGSSQANQSPNNSSIYGTIRGSNTATIGRRCSSESRQNGNRAPGCGTNIGTVSTTSQTPTAARVQEWLCNRPAVKDVGECKRSVLDQIRRGGKYSSGGPPKL